MGGGIVNYNDGNGINLVRFFGFLNRHDALLDRRGNNIGLINIETERRFDFDDVIVQSVLLQHHVVVQQGSVGKRREIIA